MDIHVLPSVLSHTIRIPGSKSHTIRALLLSLLSEGRSTIEGALLSGDGLSALTAARKFGATITEEGNRLLIDGVGSRPMAPPDIIDTANSGTTTTLFASVAALGDGYTIITGDEQIRRRTIGALAEAIRQLGATVLFTHPSRTAPPVVIGGRMGGGRVVIDGSNSQFVSSLLLSTPLLEGDSEIIVTNPQETPYVRLSLDWMERYGVSIAHDGSFSRFQITGGQHYRPGDHTIPADWSSAAFPLVAAAITDSHLTVLGVDVADSQGDRAIVDHLAAFGAHVEIDEPGHRVTVRGGTPLVGGHNIDLGPTPDMLPALAVLATQATGRTRFTNLAHVRQKETDRVFEMERTLTALGCRVHSEGDELVVDGPNTITGGRVSSSGDHRIAMALSVAGLAATGEVVIEGGECVSVSYPGFCEDLARCGAKIWCN